MYQNGRERNSEVRLPPFVLELFLSAAGAGVVGIAGTWREKVVGRKLDFSEGIAGVVGRVVALLFGYAEIVNGNQHLNVSDKLHDSKQTECYINRRTAVLQIGHNVAAYAVAYAFRYTAHIFIAVAYLAYARSQRNRVDRLNNAFRHIGASACMGVAMFVIMHGVREYSYIAVAAKQNYLFAERRYALYALRAGMGRGEDVELQEEEEGKVAGKKALVEVDRLNVYENIKYLGRTQTNAGSTVYDRLILRQEEAA